MKLKYKITLIIFINAVILMLVMSAVYINFSYKNLLEETKSILVSYDKDMAFHIEKELLKDLNMVKTLKTAYVVNYFLYKSNELYSKMPKKEIEKKLAKLNKKWMMLHNENNPFIMQYTDNMLARYLKKQKNLFPKMYGEIFVTNRYGALVASTGKLTTFKHNQKYWWKECYAQGKGKVFFDDRGFDDSVNGYVLGIVVPIKDKGRIIGIIKANIKVSALLEDMVKNYNKKGFGEVKIVRSKGLILYEKDTVPLSLSVPEELSKKLQTLKSGVTQIKNGKEYIVAYTPVKLSLKSKDIVFGGSKQSIDHKLGNDGEIWHVVIMMDKNIVFQNALKSTFKLLSIGFLFTFIMLFYLFYLIYKASKPLDRLILAVKEISKGRWNIDIKPQSDDEIGELTVAFREMLENLKKTTASKKELEQEIKRRIKAQKELEKKDKLLLIHSREAAMGEMIGMIAHQWRQPISVIAMAVNNILIELELDELKKESVKECAKEVIDETNYLSQTIDDFRNFFRSNRKKENVSIKEVIERALKIVGKTYENNDISIKLDRGMAIRVDTYANEFAQVFINLLMNAKDAFIEKSVSKREVHISAQKDEEYVVISVCDNAGGIDEKIIEKIFEPYFSTKYEKNGTGIGLYMCRMIVRKHLKGKIRAKNRDNGVCFDITIPCEEEKSE